MSQKIEKKIHYCWFGGNPLSDMAQRCIASWEKYCPDYEIIQWDETNFDVTANPYTNEAYQAKKWAFVSDYARLHAIYHQGGIYMDTDCELLKPIDDFLEEEAFSGFENKESVPTAIMGGQKGHPMYHYLLSYYENRYFKGADNLADETTNVDIITKMLLDKGLVLNNQKQTVEGFTLYPLEYFCPKDPFTGELRTTENTHAIHHFDGSWVDEEKKQLRKVKHRLCQLLGKRIGLKVYVIYYVLKKEGIKGVVARVGGK